MWNYCAGAQSDCADTDTNTLKHQSCDWCASMNHPHFDVDDDTAKHLSTGVVKNDKLDVVIPFKAMNSDPDWGGGWSKKGSLFDGEACVQQNDCRSGICAWVGGSSICLREQFHKLSDEEKASLLKKIREKSTKKRGDACNNTDECPNKLECCWNKCSTGKVGICDVKVGEVYNEEAINKETIIIEEVTNGDVTSKEVITDIVTDIIIDGDIVTDEVASNVVAENQLEIITQKQDDLIKAKIELSSLIGNLGEDGAKSSERVSELVKDINKKENEISDIVGIGGLDGDLTTGAVDHNDYITNYENKVNNVNNVDIPSIKPTFRPRYNINNMDDLVNTLNNDIIKSKSTIKPLPIKPSKVIIKKGMTTGQIIIIFLFIVFGGIYYYFVEIGGNVDNTKSETSPEL
jgi:hypothetical protein